MYLPITDYAPDLINLNAGSTTDRHISYTKRLDDEEAYVNYNIIAPYSGRVYMYLPSNYERECRLYVNGEFIKYYFENENHSIAYLGEFAQGESFDVKLELLGNDVYYEQPQFFTLDDAALARFSEKMRTMNENTVVTRTDKAKLSITVDADRDRALFTSIPIEEGWTATIDGKPAEILSTANETLMCLKVPSGKHTIELSFFPAGMKTGLILTVGGAVMFAAMIVISVVIKRQRRDNGSDRDDFETDENVED